MSRSHESPVSARTGPEAGTRSGVAVDLSDSLEFAGWRLAIDPAATAELYARLDEGGCERCGCDACFNFADARHLVYTTDWLDLLEWLGIDPLLESEVVYRHRVRRGAHVYSGWFHFVGAIEAGPRRNLGLAGSLESRYLVKTGHAVSIAFSEDARLAPDPFEGLPVVELEFSVVAPWVCDLPEPE